MAGGVSSDLAEGAAPPLLRLPLKLAAQHIVAGRLTPWERSQLSLACKHTHGIACGSVESLVLRDARFAGSGALSATSSSSGGIGAGSGAGASARGLSAGGAPPYGGGSSCSGAAGLDAAQAKPAFFGCTSLSLRPRTMANLTKMVSGLLLPGQLRARLPALEAIAIEIHDVFVAQCDLSLHITSIALHARGVRRLRIDQPGLFTVREAAAVARMPALEALAIVCTQGIEPGALSALARGATSDGGAPPPSAPCGGLRGRLRHLHIELLSDDAPIGCAAANSAAPSPLPCGGAGALAAAQWVDLSGSRIAAADAERLARVGALEGLGIAPLPAPPALLAALTAGCPSLRRVSAGGLQLPAAALTDGGGAAAAVGASLPSVAELQLLGCCADGFQLLSRAGLHLIPSAFPRLRSLEITGCWEADAAAIAAVCDLLTRCRRLVSVRLQGCPDRPLHAPLLLPLMAAAPGVRGLELLCGGG
ncbi:hypothetical protein MNEG_11817 [Monoraphidium neglectum]|uniref:Uncharacterized protein n=1 Tax=Monoraphidium neglectum TaxID=145388 RepID=A0A0D2LXN2_9CHLO|nr:hypothetical protein MNEG_11817 [Monoraphidium neglectum]KIY96144.1 hypothetical protein MNEG_11817 [Monoraphidium neglectum]|eukprot:XP_013895164.1 hypothetical protein MNEG_11817 [Monoraphidium neglectum]